MKLKYTHEAETTDVDVQRDGQHFTVSVGDRVLELEGQALSDGRLHLWVDGQPVTATVAKKGTDRYVHVNGSAVHLQRATNHSRRKKASGGGGGLTSPMPGQVLKVLCALGDTVKEGQSLMLIEAMKMEHAIKAPHDGTVTAIHFKASDMVGPGSPLLAISKDETSQDS